MRRYAHEYLPFVLRKLPGEFVQTHLQRNGTRGRLRLRVLLGTGCLAKGTGVRGGSPLRRDGCHKDPMYGVRRPLALGGRGAHGPEEPGSGCITLILVTGRRPFRRGRTQVVIRPFRQARSPRTALAAG